ALGAEVGGGLALLGPVQRRIAGLRLQGREVAEVAAAVGRSERTVRRALAGLGEELQRRLTDAAPPPVPEEELLSFADVVLQQQLGEGGMGKVYRARLRDGTAVAGELLRKPLP